MSNFLYKLKESSIFQYSVIFIIVINAITIGVGTYDLDDLLSKVISILDYSITIFFVIEIIIRFIGGLGYIFLVLLLFVGSQC